jgi:hypothetical protein
MYFIYNIEKNDIYDDDMKVFCRSQSTHIIHEIKFRKIWSILKEITNINRNVLLTVGEMGLSYLSELM